MERFIPKVNKTDTCWLWTGHISKEGYGKFSLRKNNVRVETLAHRISWIIHNGPIPDGMCVLHDCPGGDNPACCNPDHLWRGTDLDNHKDREEKGRGNQPKGEKNGQSKLTESQVIELRRRYRKNCATFKQLGIEFGISATTAESIVKGKIWKHLLPTSPSITEIFRTMEMEKGVDTRPAK